MLHRPVPWAVLIVSFLFNAPLTSMADAFDDELARQEALERQLSAVNEGRLEFLPKRPPGPPVHHQHTRVIVGDDSLQSGWVGLQQCHTHLDAVASTEIVFNPERVTELRVDSHAGIGDIVIDGSRVQLRDVGENARLCISTRSRALRQDETGKYVLRNGPFLRRFLDGYYPMHVSMEVSWPAQALRFVAARPAPQPGFEVTTAGTQLHVEAWFEGPLVTELKFEPA
ncbi:MAG: hypothetical protein M0R77_09335 [Gammaproteobacteria bacterium]|nr:hypothetical protein [Gammaproteobacteria bacterium]